MSLNTVFAAGAAALALTNCAFADTPWTHDPDADAIGRIYYYERSNSDGSLDERITMFRRDATNIEVYKENGICLGAALVTAELDLETFSAPSIIGGRLRPNAEMLGFAYLTQQEGSSRVDLDVQLPDMQIVNDVEVQHANWHLFDYDLATLTVGAPHLDNRTDGFDFGMALLWADPGVADPLFWMGDVEAEFAGRESHLGYQSERYELSGSAFGWEMSTGREGTLWLDAEDGHIVDAVFPVPNHPGYTDFRLRLLHVSDGGEAEWTALLTRHYANCD